MGSRTDKLEQIVLQKVVSSHSVGAHSVHEGGASTHKSPSINIQQDYTIEEEDNVENSSQMGSSSLDKAQSTASKANLGQQSLNDENLKKQVNTLKNAMRLPNAAKSKGYVKDKDSEGPSLYKQKLEEMAALQANDVDYDGLVQKLLGGE